MNKSMGLPLAVIQYYISVKGQDHGKRQPSLTENSHLVLCADAPQIASEIPEVVPADGEC